MSDLIEKELRLPQGFLDFKCSDADILEIYQHIVYSKGLGGLLGLTDPELHAVEQDAQSEQERPLLLLKKWKQRFSFMAKRRNLIDALYKIGQFDQAYKVCKVLYPNYYKGPSESACHQSVANIPVQEQTPDPPGGQPTSMSSPPYNAQSQPTSMQSQPYSAPSQPTSMQSQPYSAPSQPTSMQSQPYSAPSQPTSMQSQPYRALSQPTSMQSQPYSASSQPTSISSQPYSAPSQPTSMQSQPYRALSQPTSMQSQPYSASSQPTSMQSQFSYSLAPQQSQASRMYVQGQSMSMRTQSADGLASQQSLGAGRDVQGQSISMRTQSAGSMAPQANYLQSMTSGRDTAGSLQNVPQAGFTIPPNASLPNLLPSGQSQSMSMHSQYSSIQSYQAPETRSWQQPDTYMSRGETASSESGPPTGFAVEASQMPPAPQGHPSSFHIQHVGMQSQAPNQHSQPSNMPGQFPVSQNQPPASVIEQAVSLNRPAPMTGEFAMVQNQHARMSGQLALNQNQLASRTGQPAAPIQSGQHQVLQNQPGSMYEQAISLKNHPANMTGELAMPNQSPGQPLVAQNNTAGVPGQTVVVQTQTMVVSGQSPLVQNQCINAQAQSNATVQDVSEGVQDMELGEQPVNGVNANGAKHRVDADDSGEDEADDSEEEGGVEDDGMFKKRKKKTIQLVSKGQKKKPADPPANPPANPPAPHDPPSRSTSIEDDEYQMSAKPPGIGIVINNKKFDPRSHLGTRSGTDVDAKKLVDLFKWLGFETRRYNDQSAEQMKKLLEEVSKEYDKHGKYDCVIVAILSHGGDNGVLWGSDGQEVMVKSLTRYFDGNYCKSLVNKPKVFILQACRGGKRDKFVETTDADTQPDSLMPAGDDHGVESDFRKSVPSENGFILAFSTTPGYLSWRHTDTGSWYINVLEEKMRKYAGRKHFVDILTKVNRKLSESEEFVTGTHKQMSSYESRLTRDLMFKPPPQS